MRIEHHALDLNARASSAYGFDDTEAGEPWHWEYWP